MYWLVYRSDVVARALQNKIQIQIQIQIHFIATWNINANLQYQNALLMRHNTV